MQKRAGSFQNPALTDHQNNQLEESSFVDEAEKRDKVDLACGAGSMLGSLTGSKAQKSKKKKGANKSGVGLRVRTNSNAVNASTAGAHLSNAINDP